jgi:hypothetical protein
MKLLVTGAPGSGKTALAEYAVRAGYNNFFDTDKVPGLCEWREYSSGKVIGSVEDIEPQGGDSWYKTYGWYWRTQKLAELLQTPNPVICGSADNIMEFYGLFDQIILLYKNRADLVSNLMQPNRDQPNGKDPSHHDRILKWQETLADSLKSFRPIIINDNNLETSFQDVIQVLKT